MLIYIAFSIFLREISRISITLTQLQVALTQKYSTLKQNILIISEKIKKTLIYIGFNRI